MLRLSLFIDRDFVLQRFHVLLQLLHLLFQAALMVFKHYAPLRDGGRTLAAQVSKADHLRDRHACFAQADKQGDPANIFLRVAPMAA